MKIVIDCRMMNSSGIGRYIKEHLTRMPVIKVPVLCICSTEAEASWVTDNIPQATSVVDTSAIYSVREQFSRLRYSGLNDVVWTPHYNITVLALGRQVVTVHDVVHIALPHIFGRGLKRLYAQFMLWAVSVRAKPLIFVSEFTRGEFSRLVRRVPEARTQVTLCGIKQSTLPDQPVKGDYFIYVGNVKPHKNLGRLLRAFAQISDRTATNLLIVGKRDGFITGDSLAAELENPKLQGRVKFTGHVADAELADLYSRAKALVFPSLYEGFGLPPLEAMTAGCPVITSNAASIPEVCGPEYDEITKTGSVLYFNPEDENAISARILEFLAMPVSAVDQMVTNGRAHSLKWKWENTTRQTWDIILRNV